MVDLVEKTKISQMIDLLVPRYNKKLGILGQIGILLDENLLYKEDLGQIGQ